MPRRPMRYPRFLKALLTLLIWPISLGLALPSSALALRESQEDSVISEIEKHLAGGLEEEIVFASPIWKNLDVSNLGDAKRLSSARVTFSQLIAIKEGRKDPLRLNAWPSATFPIGFRLVLVELIVNALVTQSLPETQVIGKAVDVETTIFRRSGGGTIFKMSVRQESSGDVPWEQLKINQRGFLAGGVAYLSDQHKRGKQGARLYRGLGLAKVAELMGETPVFLKYTRSAASPFPVETEIYVQLHTAGLEEETWGQRLRRVAGGTPRFLTGEKNSYDVLAQKGLPHTLVPELAGGLSPLLDRFEAAGTPYTWVDGAAQFGTALKEAQRRYPHLRTVAVELVPWARADLGHDIADKTEAEGRARGLAPEQMWSTEGFLREDLSRVRLPHDPEAPIRLVAVFHALSFNPDPLGMLVHLYNQLPDEAYLLANLYIPTEYDPAGVSEGFQTADEVVAFWRDRLPAALKAYGISMDVRVTDDREVGVPEYHLGLAFQKTPGTLELALRAHAKPVVVQTLRRSVEYQLAWYTGDLDHPFRYSAAGLEATVQPAAPVQPTPALDTQL